MDRVSAFSVAPPSATPGQLLDVQGFMLHEVRKSQWDTTIDTLEILKKYRRTRVAPGD